LTDFCRDQPLVLAGLGIAIGAALGALLPSTDAEDDLMGTAADEVKNEVRETASATYEKAAAVAETAFEAGAEEASRQGLVDLHDASPSKADEAASLVPDDVDERDANISRPLPTPAHER
jgi:hypothetical protein